MQSSQTRARTSDIEIGFSIEPSDCNKDKSHVHGKLLFDDANNLRQTATGIPDWRMAMVCTQATQQAAAPNGQKLSGLLGCFYKIERILDENSKNKQDYEAPTEWRTSTVWHTWCHLVYSKERLLLAWIKDMEANSHHTDSATNVWHYRTSVGTSRWPRWVKTCNARNLTSVLGRTWRSEPYQLWFYGADPAR